MGDGTGRVIAIGERECSLQRRNQKIIEIAPSPSLSPAMRAELQGKQASMPLPRYPLSPSLLLSGAATSILPPQFSRRCCCRSPLFCSCSSAAAAIHLMSADPPLNSLCTVEFLVRGDDFWFIEANPRLQVEHTVTEAVFGLDLVAIQVHRCCSKYVHLSPHSSPQLQLSIFQRSLDHPDLAQVASSVARGCAIQARVSLERMLDPATGAVAASGGRISAFDLPSGPGVKHQAAARVNILFFLRNMCCPHVRLASRRSGSIALVLLATRPTPPSTL